MADSTNNLTDKSLNKLIKLAAGSNYVLNGDTQDGKISVTHRRCGHTFTVNVSEIALHGFSCSRCNDSLSGYFRNTSEEIKSMELYNKCMEVLPAGFELYGSTVSEDCIIKVSRPNCLDFSIKIADLLNGENLPDCLLHRSAEIIPSVQLQILDKLMDKNEEILDDFLSLEDTIRIKNNSTGEIISNTVKNVLEGAIQRVGTYNQQISEVTL